jgi:hypothetical protein
VPAKLSQTIAARSLYRYRVYNVCLQSEIRLPLPEALEYGSINIELRAVSTSSLRKRLGDTPLQRIGRTFYQHAILADGSSYVRWDGIGEFLISRSGGVITCARFRGASSESFQVYLLGQALSFALVKSGFEPIHATCVVIDGQGVAFLGNSGRGKSSLAAYFLQVGDLLLTDDLLVIRDGVEGLQAYPGPARIKLLPGMARRLLGKYTSGVPMNPQTQKQIISLKAAQICSAPVPLKALYALGHEGRDDGKMVPRSEHMQCDGDRVRRPATASGIHIRRLSLREGFVNLLSHAFNYVLVDRDRLRRQFTEVLRLTRRVPLSEVYYPRTVESLAAVRKAILADLHKQI